MRMLILDWIVIRFGLEWIVYHYHFDFGVCKVIIAPFYDGTILKDDLLKREVPFWFLVFVKLLHPEAKVVVRGIITQEDILSEMSYYRRANLNAT